MNANPGRKDMSDRFNRSSSGNGERDCFDLQALLHPADAFAHPRDVVRDPDLTLNEKRAILASWASDACAIEAAPALRRAPDGRTVRFDDVMDALRLLDRQAADAGMGRAPYRRMLGTRRDSRHGRGSGEGHMPN
jgi:hypothetical protein